MEIEKKEAQDLKAVETRSTCEECGEYGHVHKDCPEEAKVLDYMRKGDLPNFRYGQVDLNLMQAHPFRIRFGFIYN
jgi:ribosomal protein L32